MSDEKKYGGINAFQWFLSNLKIIFSEKGHTHTIDSALSSTSTNPVQNKVIDAEFDAVSTAMGILEAEIDKKSDTNHKHLLEDITDFATTINNIELITVDDIDTICGTTIQVANASEVTF